MKLLHALQQIGTFGLLLSVVAFAGCHKEKDHQDLGFKEGDTLGVAFPDWSPDDTASRVTPAGLDTGAWVPSQDSHADTRGKHTRKGQAYDYDDDDGDDASAYEEAEKERRMKKLNRDFDAGLYGEHIRGFDRDNYDPDIDDW